MTQATGVTGQTGTDRWTAVQWHRLTDPTARLLGRTAKLLTLLVVITLALISTILLDHSSQIAVLKAFLVLVLAVVPGWLYLQFIDKKAPQLYDEYVLNLFRLRIDRLSNLPKPPPGSSYWPDWEAARIDDGKSADDVARNVYLQKFAAVYGDSAVLKSRRDLSAEDDARQDSVGIVNTIRQETFSPVIVMTMLTAVGWVAFVQPEIYGQLRLLGPEVLSGLPTVAAEPLRFGFLGAYTFILQSFVRRYFASDLKTRAFVTAILRLILVAALVLVVNQVWALSGNESLAGLELAFAFLIGYFPDSAFRLLKAQVGDRLRSSETVEEQFPLRDLDGLNLWYETRFVEEGVENMQNLATTSIVDLMINTRTPVARLVDWIDQACLYLRVHGEEREVLRRLGIRNATDLIQVHDRSRDEDPDFHAKLLRALNGGGRGGASRIQALRYALDTEVNLTHVRHFRAHGWLDAPPAVV